MAQGVGSEFKLQERKKKGRKGGREGGREGGRKEGKKEGRKGERNTVWAPMALACSPSYSGVSDQED
jgi:hypothetical protein